MAITNIPDRDGSDPNASADINTLNDNDQDLQTQIDALGGGSDGVAFYIPGNAYVANGIVRLNIPKAATVTKILARVITAPTGSALTLNVRKNSDSTNDISSSDLSISAGTNTANSTTLDGTHKVFAENDYITVAVTAKGSTTPGTDLMVTLIY
jgi:hypothetical protein